MTEPIQLPDPRIVTAVRDHIRAVEAERDGYRDAVYRAREYAQDRGDRRLWDLLYVAPMGEREARDG